MPEVLVYPTAQLRERIGDLRRDQSLSPTERERRLAAVRDEAHSIVSLAEAAMGDARMEGEAGAALEARDLARAREDADIRDELVRRGLATHEALDGLGVPSHADLDARVEDGSIGNRLEELREFYWREWLYRRVPEHMIGGGEFAPKPGQAPAAPAPRARGGASRSATAAAAAATPGAIHAGARPAVMPQEPSLPSAPRPRAPAAPAPGEPSHVLPRSLEHASPPLAHVRTPLQDEVLGPGVVSTAEKHSTVGPDGVRRYTPERRTQHREWLTEVLGGHAEGLEQPEILFTAGGPASGKSSIIEGEGARVPQPEDAVHLDQDIFKQKIEEYQQLAEARDPYASDSAHQEASDLYRVALAEAMRRRMNVIAEGTGDSGPGQFASRIKEAKAAGYRTRVIYASAPTAVAEERAQFRAKKTGRAVPLEGLRAMHANVSKRFGEVLRDGLGSIDELSIWDTRAPSWEGGEPTLMAGTGDIARRFLDLTPDDPGAFHVADEALYQQFLAKADENPGDLIDAPTFV